MGIKKWLGLFIIQDFSKDINMRDIVKCSGKILDGLDGLVFVGGFSYADVLGAGVGWASSIKYNESISSQFSNFYNKENTFKFRYL